MKNNSIIDQNSTSGEDELNDETVDAEDSEDDAKLADNRVTLQAPEPVFKSVGLQTFKTSCTDVVKSIPLTTENWLRKLYTYSKKNYMSTEDKHETNHINNKYNDTNTDTRKMHNT